MIVKCGRRKARSYDLKFEFEIPQPCGWSALNFFVIFAAYASLKDVGLEDGQILQRGLDLIRS
jgi:hypothetical protein